MLSRTQISPEVPMRSVRLVRLVPCSVAFVSMAVLALAAPAPAQAQPVFGSGNGSGGGAGLGVGAAVFLSGMPGVEVAYDLPRFHLEGLIGFDTRDAPTVPGVPTRTEFTVGVRGWYHLHQGTNSDFSVGVGFGFDHLGFDNNAANNALGGTETFVEPGAEARVFLTPNFALFGLAGFSLAFGDAVRVPTGAALTSQVNAGFGFIYFFR
jgi:hypothetical protein